MMDETNPPKKWGLPDLEGDQSQASSLFGRPATWYSQEKKEKPEKNKSISPLTLDDIEAIRLSAYEDGFNEGNEAGFAQGLENGNEQGLKQGVEQGLIEGIEQGLEESQKQIEELTAKWESLIERLHNPLEKLDANVEYQLINLATSLAEQITRCEVEKDPQIILQALKQGVEALPVSEQVLTILLHPDDLNFVQQAYSSDVCLQRKWDLQPEATLQRGDCQIHTQTSSIDYAFDTRIKQVLSQFFRKNFETLPHKNNDSNLLNDEPMIAEESFVEGAIEDVTQPEKTGHSKFESEENTEIEVKNEQA